MQGRVDTVFATKRFELNHYNNIDDNVNEPLGAQEVLQ